MTETNATQHPLVVEFTKNIELFQGFQASTETLVCNLLRHKNVNVHAITSRTKDPQSLAEKIERKQGKYKSLGDITDLVGVRIIVYYGDDVDQVAEIISDQFKLDTDNSIDKRKSIEPERFGYVSLHSVVELLEIRHCLPEYERYKEMKCEIQIRTILQHAWAAVEHSLGYKSEVSIPDASKRRFSRLAGLLELGDQEFMTIRDEISEYKEKVKEAIATPKETRITEEEIQTDAVSLFSYITSSQLVADVDKEICQAVSVYRSDLSGWYADVIALACQYCNLNNLSEVEQALRRNRVQVVNFTVSMVKSNPDGPVVGVTAGVCLYQLCHYLVASKGSTLDVANFLFAINRGPETLPDDENDYTKIHFESLYERFVDAARAAQQEASQQVDKSDNLSG